MPPDQVVLDTLETLQGSMDERMGSLAEAQEVLATEVRERGGVTKETKETVDTLEGELRSLTEAVEELKEIAPDLLELKQNMERPGAPSQRAGSSPGERFAGSTEYKSWKDDRENKSKEFELGSIDNLLPERKALTSDEGVWCGAGLLIEPMLLPGILQDPQRQLRFRDLVNVQQVTTDSVRY